MYILLTDETNLNAGEKVKFFSYGGLIVKTSKMARLHNRIQKIRDKYGYKPEDRLKFDTNARPKGLSQDDATKAKHAVINACIKCECKFIAYVMLHDICKNQKLEQVIKWGANHVIGKFNYFLNQNDSHGIVALDRLPDGVEFSYLEEKFTKGLEFPGEKRVTLDNIVLFSSTCINSSHISSAMDIVLGSWRYCINKPANEGAAKSMMQDIMKLMWCVREGDDIHAFEKGLIFRPKTVKIKAYKAEYDALLAHVNTLLQDAE